MSPVSHNTYLALATRFDNTKNLLITKITEPNEKIKSINTFFQCQNLCFVDKTHNKLYIHEKFKEISSEYNLVKAPDYRVSRCMNESSPLEIRNFKAVVEYLDNEKYNSLIMQVMPKPPKSQCLIM